MKKYLFIGSFLLLSAGVQAQIAISDVTNDGGAVYDFSNAEVVTTDPVSGIGYQSKNGGVAYHYGPAAATLTVNGIYDAFTGTPATPGVDYFQGLDGAKGTVAEIAGTTRPVFGILNLDNGAANTVNITNSQGISIGQQLNFTNGITTTVRSTSTNGAIRFQNSATYTNNNLGNAQHVNGYVTKAGTQAFTYPVGDQPGAELHTLSISAPATATDELGIAYWKGDVSTALDPTGGAHSRASLNTTPLNGEILQSVSPIGFWDWVSVSGTSTLTITASLPAQTGSGSYSSATNIRLVGWNITNAQWELLGNTGASSLLNGATLGGTTNAYAGRTMASYSAIGFGSIGQLPLPIGLLLFTGKAAGCSVILSWATATEQGSDYFAIQRSANGKDWSEIRRVAAAGSSNTLLNYQTTDESPATAAANYYRLQMADRDGATKYSNVVAVVPDCGLRTGIAISPNPFEHTLQISGMTPGSSISIWSGDGRLIWSGAAVGTTSTTVNTAAWVPGHYLLRVMHENEEVATKQIVKQ